MFGFTPRDLPFQLSFLRTDNVLVSQLPSYEDWKYTHQVFEQSVTSVCLKAFAVRDE